MKSSRSSRFIGACIALVSMLFMQLAIAGYVCPSVTVGQPAAATAMPMTLDAQSMPGCDKMDAAQPSLCHADAHAQQQSLDKQELPAVQPFIPAMLTLVFQNIDLSNRSVVSQPATVLLTRATAPPLSIRNCCFRI